MHLNRQSFAARVAPSLSPPAEPKTRTMPSNANVDPSMRKTTLEVEMEIDAVDKKIAEAENVYEVAKANKKACVGVYEESVASLRKKKTEASKAVAKPIELFFSMHRERLASKYGDITSAIIQDEWEMLPAETKDDFIAAYDRMVVEKKQELHTVNKLIDAALSSK